MKKPIHFVDGISDRQCKNCNCKIITENAVFFSGVNRCSNYCRKCYLERRHETYLGKYAIQKDKIREQNLKKRFNMTNEEYEEMLASQNGLCAICHQKNSKEGERLAIDHDHETGEVRALLCYNCNTLLGHCKENTQILANALSYLLKYRKFEEVA